MSDLVRHINKLEAMRPQKITKNRQLLKKKIIEKENYLEFIKKKFKSLLLKPENYLYFSLAILVFGIYWYETSFNRTLEIAILLCTSCAVIFFVIELFFAIVYRKVETNNLITRFCFVLFFGIVSFIYYDDSYFHSLKLFIIILLFPIIIVYIVNKIRILLNL